MKKCRVCNLNVHNFNHNSTVLPKWPFTPIHVNGQLLQINLPELRFGDFLCENCDRKITLDDSFSKNFCFDKAFIKKEIKELNENGNIKDLELISNFKSIEVYNVNLFYRLKTFLFSYLIRNCLYLVESNKKPLLPDNILKDICKIYFDKDRSKLENKYPIIIWKELDECSLSLPTPEMIGGVNSVKFNFLYFRFFIQIDEKNSIHEKYKRFEVTKEKVNCFIFQDKNPYRGIKYFRPSKTNNQKVEEIEILN